jgi:hypothetical protein
MPKIEKNYTENLIIKVTKEMKEKIRKKAIENSSSMSSYIKFLINNNLKNG